MAERKHGYYYVKSYNDWEIALWENGHWSVMNTPIKYQDYNFQEIGQRIPSNETLIARDEEVKELLTSLDRLKEACLASDFNEHWDAYKEAEKLLIKYSKPTP